MAQEVLALIAGLVILILLACGGGAVFLMRSRSEQQAKVPAAQGQGAPQAGGQRRLAAAARRRRQQANQAQNENAEQEDEEDLRGPQRPVQEAGYSRKDAYEERRRKRDEEREAKQLAEEELAAKKEAERKEREDAEAEKWLGQISTEQEGTDALDSEEQQGVLSAFVAYIEETKTVVLEDLAADFNMRVQDVIARVQTLEAEGRITGVMDDRGKFIYISKPEMEAVAEFIKKKGRVSISELAAKSNTFIDLEAKAVIKSDNIELDLDLDNDEQEA